MKILLASDIHLEFKQLERIPALPDPSKYDVVLLAGDIGMNTQGVEWAEEFFPKDKKIYYICGNHEFYREYKDDLLTELQKYNSDRLFIEEPSIFLDKDTVLISATLWSGLTPSENINRSIERNVNDFRLIKIHGKRTDYKDIISWHEKDLEIIRRELDTYKNTPNIIVMTHFLPLWECIDPKYLENDPAGLNNYFANRLDHLFEEYEINLWVFGHTHCPKDFIHKSGARLVCNPFGYPGENKDVNWKLIEL